MNDKNDIDDLDALAGLDQQLKELHEDDMSKSNRNPDLTYKAASNFSRRIANTELSSVEKMILKVKNKSKSL